MYSELLPLGSVVDIEGAQGVLVVGRVASKAGEDKVYDYIGVPYPEGLGDTDEMLFFDQDDIDSIDFIGCKNNIEMDFRENVLEKLDEIAPLTVKNGQIVSAKA